MAGKFRRISTGSPKPPTYDPPHTPRAGDMDAEVLWHWLSFDSQDATNLLSMVLTLRDRITTFLRDDQPLEKDARDIALRRVYGVARELMSGVDREVHLKLEPETRLLATFATATALLFCGQTRGAQAVADRSFAFARDHASELREHAWGTLAAWMAVRLESGRDRGELEPLVRHVHAHAVRHDDDELIGLAEITLGRVALAHGDLDAAVRWLSEGDVHLGDCDPRYVRGLGLAMLARTEASRGRPEHAVAALARADATYPAMQRTHSMYRHEYARAHAWVAAASGDLRRGQTIAMGAAADCGQYLLTEITFLHDALRLGSPPVTVATRLATLAAKTDSELAHAQADHATAAQRQDPAAIGTGAERFAELGANLLAAEAQSSATELFAQRGDNPAARRSAARARELLIRCPGAQPQPFGDLRLPTLTQREDHVARLAASGLTNHEIAAQLVVSLRTVESHLYHAFDKLGIHNRDQLEDHLGTHTQPRTRA